ncbi:glycoside hydrolase superfamily, partial [Suillus spraguei]
FVSEAQSHGVEAHVAVGGWLGSVWFSSNIATSKNRTTFVKTLTDFVDKYKLDGIQFSWEYPGKQGVGCNKISVDDTSNYLQFLQEFRKNTAGTNLTVSAAVSLEPFTDSSGKPSADVSGFAQVFDYITLMNYDVWGPWATNVGPNAPLNDTCAPPEHRQGSAVSAIKAWTAAGMPINKIVLGVASYGHSFWVSPSDAFDSGLKTPDLPGSKASDVPGTDTPQLPALKTQDGTNTPDKPGKRTPVEPSKNTPDLPSSKTPDVAGTSTPGEPGTRMLAAYPAFDASKQPLGDAWDDTSSVDVCGVRHGPGGTFRFWGLVDAGFLNKDGAPADGIDVRYDECSQTPYAYNETSQVMISFDNARSFAAKGKYIKDIGLRGFTMWEVAGDHNDILLDSIRKAMGVNTPGMLFIPVPAPTTVTTPHNLIHVPNISNSNPNVPDLPTLNPDFHPNLDSDASNLVSSDSNSVPNAPNSVPNSPNPDAPNL